MGSIIQNFYLELETPVVLSDTKAVVGYDSRLQQPVLDVGSGPVHLSSLQRAAWDNDEEAFTDSELKQIWAAVYHLKKEENVSPNP